jgi:hypothetical protein
VRVGVLILDRTIQELWNGVDVGLEWCCCLVVKDFLFVGSRRKWVGRRRSFESSWGD